MREAGGRFFGEGIGLKVFSLADAVRAQGPIMVDDSAGFWVYAGGVWRPDRGEVLARTTGLLGERYRPAHHRAVREFLQGECARFEVGPVPALINFRNGMLRWADEDLRLLEHHAEFMSTVRLPLDWEPGEVCPEFDRFLTEAVPADDRDRAWQVLGYLLMSGNPLQRLFMLTGSGGNGKGVYLNVVRALLGDDNVSAVPLQEFSESQFATAELFGKLANVCGDIDATFIQNTGRIKELSGDDRMKGERKFGHPFYFTFWGKAVFSANAIPGAADSSRGWLRRWEIVQFPYAPPKPDPELSKRIIASELPGIAVKAVRALRSLMAVGEFSRGESADLAHAEFAEKNNRATRWINDPDSNVARDKGVFNPRKVLLRAFRSWEREEAGNSSKETGSITFYGLLKQTQMAEEGAIQGKRGFYGIRVRGHTFGSTPEEEKLINHVASKVQSSAPTTTDGSPGQLL